MVLITADAKALGSPSKLAPLVAVPRLRLQSALLRKSKMRGEIALIAVRPRRRRIVPFHRGIRGRAEAWAKARTRHRSGRPWQWDRCLSVPG